jgi:glycyl-tRNA synthetase
MDKIVALCKRRGFIFQSSEIYGGLASTYDYGHYGVLLKNNVKAEWWRAVVQERDDMVALDAAILMHPKTWEASGHLEGFSDPLVQCLGECKQRFREDHLREAIQGEPRSGEGDRVPRGELRCPVCGGELSEPRQFNLMFQTNMGPVVEEGSTIYLRPETAQGIFVNFKNVLQFSRKKPPFGIAQIGKSFRNEITPGNFIFRTREFEQMEMEYFCRPENGPEWFDYWRDFRWNWYQRIGIKASSLRRYDHPREKLSHYSAGTTDIEFLYPFGWGELEGIAYRTDFDLKQHGEATGKSLTYFDEESKERIAPHVVEPAVGVDRIMLICLIDAYDEDEVDGERRVVLHLHPRIAPVQVAVLPLSRKLGPLAREVWGRLRRHFVTQNDEAQSIGRRYRRQDEIGTPLCVTVDFETEERGVVTIRDRDTTQQDKNVPIDELVDRLKEKVEAS